MKKIKIIIEGKIETLNIKLITKQKTKTKNRRINQ